MTDRPASQMLPNTLALESRARQVFYAQSPQELVQAASRAAAEKLRLVPLGAGSNVVLPPRLNAAVVFVTDDSIQLIDDSVDEAVLRIGAGKDWHALVMETLEAGQYGLENLALIPGCVGAAPVQNIGAYGRELAEYVDTVHGVDLCSLELQSLSREACEFTYRDSVFKQRLNGRFVITSVDLRLHKQPKLEAHYPSLASQLEKGAEPLSPQSVCAAVIAVRKQRLPDPSVEPNVGSFFKNPVIDSDHFLTLQEQYAKVPGHQVDEGRYKVPAAWLIEQCGLQGYRIGDAGVSSRHALVLINHGHASQGEVLALATHIQERVKEAFQISLSVEPRILSGD